MMTTRHSHVCSRIGMRTADGGFTLLDNLIALAILSFITLGLAALASTMISSKATMTHRVIAGTLAQDKIEDVRRQGYDFSLIADATITEPYGAGTGSIPGYPLFQRVTVTQVNAPVPGMHTVTVTVYWSQDNKSVSLRTQLAP
ncbi:MAG: type IV pilus modification PilV family protein [Nitrospirales bacterium]